MALPDAESETDIAAIPGRVHAMRGRVNVPSNPEFGASQHVARILLAVMAVDDAVRSAVNLRTSDELLEAAREQGYETVAFDASYENRRERIESLLADQGAVPAVLYHEGAFGIEPITYVFGSTAVEAVERAITCLDSE